MRPVQVYDNGMQPSYKGVFLGFSCLSEELEHGGMVVPVALVEHIEGTQVGCVEAVFYGNIRFLDTAEKVQRKPKNGDVPYQEIIDAYHEILPMLSKVRVLTTQRKQQMQRRWNNELPDIEAWKAYFKDVSKSRFLTGKALNVKNPGWKADIDWLLKPGNLAKVSEGKYHA